MSDDNVSGGFEGDEVPQNQIRRTWRKQYPNKPMPKIEAYNVPEKDFKRTVSHNRREGSREGEVKEYGRHLPLNKTTGTLIKDESTNTYLILHRSNASGSVQGTVKHEMRHIAEKEGYGKSVHSRVGGGEAYQHGTIKTKQSNNPFSITQNIFGLTPSNFNPSKMFGIKETTTFFGQRRKHK